MDGDPGELFVVDAVGRRLLAALAHGPLDLGELGSRIGLSAADCAAAVIELEICGRCSRLPGGRVIGHAPLC
jgi:predicted Rossmann fold nucleotide-binding protein DprA/Smf involved in DNA uptake